MGHQADFGFIEPEAEPTPIDTEAIAAAGARRSPVEQRFSEVQQDNNDFGGGQRPKPPIEALTPENLHMPRRPQRVSNFDALHGVPIKNDPQLALAQANWDNELDRRIREATGTLTAEQRADFSARLRAAKRGSTDNPEVS